MVRVSFDIQRDGERRPVTITMIPQRLVGEEYTPDTVFDLAVRMRYQVLNELERSMITWRRREFENVDGVLMMYNHEDENHTYLENVKVKDLTGETFLNSFEKATGTGSNPDLRLSDVDWKYWINPASYIRGGSVNFTNKKKLQGIFGWDKKLAKVMYYDNEEIGCAAFALANSLQCVLKEFNRERFNQQKYTRYVHKLQQNLAFTDPKKVTLHELEKIVELYPDFRLVVISNLFFRPHIANGRNYKRDSDKAKDKSLYIYYDLESEHYVTITGLYAFYSSLKKFKVKLCYECCVAINPLGTQECLCSSVKSKPQQTKRVECEFCNETYIKYMKHVCGESKCKFCAFNYKTNNSKEHRCPLTVDEKSMIRLFKGDENKYISHPENTPQYELWAWDIESHFVQMPNPIDENGFLHHESFIKDEQGYYKTENDRLVVTFIRKCSQLANYIYCRNVFTGEEKEFESLEDFIDFTFYNNDGYNYFYAHNSSGYDSRLLFETASKKCKEAPKPTMKGSKMMTLQLGKTFFHDSMLHLPGSLKRQGESFKLSTTKGDFPHGFSLLENIDYEGPIPAIEYFPDRFKNEKELKEFKEWHQSQVDSGYVWNYREERKKYCRNDVLMLAEVMRISHENTLALFKDYPHLQLSPWFCPTIAGYHHKLQLWHLHIHQDLHSMSVEERSQYAETSWLALEPEEHYFAYKALRGGMTNICKYIHEGPAHYVDIQSSYPNVQMTRENLYPVGSPTIEIHDKNSFPCAFCYFDMSCCTHSYKQRLANEEKRFSKKLKIVEVQVDDIESYCRNFTGIICVDLIPPTNLYHPLVQEFDLKKKKVIGSLEPISKTTIPCVILHRAMDVGYKVTKIYRADRYRLAESKWRNGLLGDMYLAKMKNAGKVDEKDHDRIKKTFKEKFDIELGDLNEWEDNPTMKATAKILINCGWGKHAESVDHPQAVLYKQDGTEGMDFYQALLINEFKLSNIQKVGDNVMFKYAETRKKKRPHLHKTYLPVAVYVTAYGRLSLWNELIKVDPPGTPADKLRVLMYDTDSIVYACNDHDHEYHVKEGDCLGDWETEKIESKGEGIQAFYSIGPKSYAIVPNKGAPLLKLKGAYLEHAHAKLMNPKVMKSLVLDRSVVELPQTTLDYRVGKDHALSFRNYRKIIQFNLDDVKGVFDASSNRAFPYGFSEISSQ